MEGSEF